VELKVTATSRDGAGVARSADGRVVFVEGALPGETVEAVLLREEKRWSRARVLKVLAASSDRVPVSCNHQLAGCGGCDLLHLDPDGQADMKATIVAEQLSRAGVDVPTIQTRGLENDTGRTTVRVAVLDDRAGYREAGSHDVVIPSACLAVDPTLEELLVDGRYGGAEEVAIRVGARTNERLVLVDGDPFEVEVPDDVIVVSRAELLEGRRAWIHEEAAGRTWRVSARSFFQNRPSGVDALVKEVAGIVEALGTDGPLVDAYSGIGIFAGTIGVNRRVTAIERGADSVADARVNLAESEVKIIKAPVETWKATRAAVVIADPAREGLGKPGVAALTAAQPELFVLVSCDPASFARDAGLLESAGLRLQRATVVDMFPGTSHIETVGAFTGA
jgi:23S rRNA (uracil1939-C5)-methyltransferase